MRSRQKRGTAQLFLCAAFMACDASSRLVQTTNDPVVIVTLAVDAPFPAPAAQTAIVANTSSPRDYDFRDAEEFRMTRAADEMRFGWVSTVPTTGSAFVVRGNYGLPADRVADALGARDLIPGDRIRLRVVTQGRIVTGELTLPERPAVQSRRIGDSVLVFWRRAPGAAAYRFGLLNLFSSDTSYMTESRGTTAETIFVTAVDSALYKYLRDSTVKQSGITGALGVFGSSVTTTYVIPASSSRAPN